MVVVEEMDFSGNVRIRDAEVKIKNTKASGTLIIEGNVEGEEIRVRGALRVDGALNVTIMDVIGVLRVTRSLKGEKLSARGTVKVGSSIAVSKLFVDGVLEAPSVEAAEAVVSGRLRVESMKVKRLTVLKGSEIKGSLVACEAYIERGSKVERLHARKVIIKRRVEAELVEADEVYLDRDCKVRELRYVNKLKGGEACKIDRRLRVERLSLDAVPC